MGLDLDFREVMDAFIADYLKRNGHHAKVELQPAAAPTPRPVSARRSATRPRRLARRWAAWRC
jgi:hypothetical protein